MGAFARWLVNKPVAWAVVIASLLITGALGWFALRVDQDDDLLAFLPPGNADVATFRQINERFGGLDVGIVGIRVGDPFDGDFLAKLETLTRKLNEVDAVAYALSIANVEDFTLDPEKGGFRADYLVRPLPQSPAEAAALRDKVMSRDHIVGQLISADHKAVIIYAFLKPDAKPRETANEVRSVVGEAFADHELYWGGAPFISTYIYDATQGDMKRLIPWAVAVIVLLIVASFRDVLGAALALVSTAMGIAVAHGAMGLMGVDANIVLGSMPVILFAVGSAYAIHVLVRYYAERGERDCEEALIAALSDVGPTVLAAGLTTVAGLLSFMAMDIEPMRQFGLFTGLGIAATLVLSLTFVPAVVRLLDLKARTFGKSILAAALTHVTRAARKHRVVVLVVLGAITAGSVAFTTRVEARMENAAFFSEGSPPDRAERFLRDEFGGSQFIQIMIEGDMTHPGVLRELGRLADVISLERHVSAVTHIGQVLSLVNEAFSGERRVPVTQAQVKTLYSLLAGRAAVAQLVDDKAERALLMVKIDTDEHASVAALLGRIEAIVESDAIKRYRVATDAPAARALASLRIAAELHLDQAQRDALKRELESPLAEPVPGELARDLTTFLASDESLLEDAERPHIAAMVTTLLAIGGPGDEAQISRALDEALPSPGADDAAEDGGEAGAEDGGEGAEEARVERAALIADLAGSLVTPLREIWRQARATAAIVRLSAATGIAVSEQKRAPVLGALLDASGNQPQLLPAEGDGDGALGYVVSGTPVLYRGLAKSVTQNQFYSLALAMGLVLVIMVGLFRSLWSGLLAAAPTALTLVVVYGFMGARGVHLDIGTSMLASIIIGAGVDYAVHLLAAWRGADSDEAVAYATAHAGPAIWINALMVAAGFFVLTLGDAKPLQNVGGLTSAAMLSAALITFVAIPALAKKRVYRVMTAPD
jgi:hypothetical protein